jgi:hypothetical protein
MIPYEEVRRLRTWEEAAGVLIELDEEDDILLAKIGKIVLVLPTDMSEVLCPHIRQRIAILRTDDQARPYRFRRVDPDIATKNSPIGAANTGRSDEHCAHTTGATE